jgi:hypothetical protein
MLPGGKLAASWNDNRRGACSEGQELHDKSETDIYAAFSERFPISAALN